MADNYQAEILGGCCAQLIVKVAIRGQNVRGSAVPKFGCDNMGVVLHGTQHRCPLLEKQAQADVLQYFKHLVLTFHIGSKMYHVFGHMDKLLRQNQMMPAQKVNVQADKLATKALMEAVHLFGAYSPPRGLV